MINLVVNFPDCAPVVGELQIHYRPILELKVCARRGEIWPTFWLAHSRPSAPFHASQEYEHHFLYEIIRAKKIEELIPSGQANGESEDGARVAQLESVLAEKEAALAEKEKEKEAALAEKEAALAEKEAALEAMLAQK